MNVQKQPTDLIEQRLRTAAQAAAPPARPPSLVQLRGLQLRRRKRRVMLSSAAAACAALLLLGVWVRTADRAVQQNPPGAVVRQPALPPTADGTPHPQRVLPESVDVAQAAIPPVPYFVYQTRMVLLPVSDETTEMAPGEVRVELRPVMQPIDPRELTSAERLMVERQLSSAAERSGPSL